MKNMGRTCSAAPVSGANGREKDNLSQRRLSTIFRTYGVNRGVERERKTGNFRNFYIRQDLQDLQDAVQEYLQLNRPLRSRREAR